MPIQFSGTLYKEFAAADGESGSFSRKKQREIETVASQMRSPLKHLSSCLVSILHFARLKITISVRFQTISGCLGMTDKRRPSPNAVFFSVPRRTFLSLHSTELSSFNVCQNIVFQKRKYRME